MIIINERNVNGALRQGIDFLLNYGIREQSRNGEVLVAKHPVCTQYIIPCERVVFSPTRDANPFFHFFESLWMLAGRNDVAYVAEFVKRMREFSDDGKTMHGAYGHRWRASFGYDQLETIVEELKSNPQSRRCVLAMWDGSCHASAMDDLHVGVSGGKDVPCNTHAYFDVRNNALNMTVCNRSNDIIWGAYGANAVHFSMLQEYIARKVGVEVGVYRQFSNNYHTYTWQNSEDKLRTIAAECEVCDIYSEDYAAAKPYPLMQTSGKLWDLDLEHFMENFGLPINYSDPFFSHVVYPMSRAWLMLKEDTEYALHYCNVTAAKDWCIACAAWIKRRDQKENAA